MLLGRTNEAGAAPFPGLRHLFPTSKADNHKAISWYLHQSYRSLIDRSSSTGARTENHPIREALAHGNPRDFDHEFTTRNSRWAGTLTWPGYTGVLQAVAPARFAALGDEAPEHLLHDPLKVHASVPVHRDLCRSEPMVCRLTAGENRISNHRYRLARSRFPEGLISSLLDFPANGKVGANEHQHHDDAGHLPRDR
jgi:hypothetical protein